jgi:putative membrane protein
MEQLDKSDPRLYLAAERTYLSWIRTGLALMGFGFVVARFGLFLREMGEMGVPPESSGPSLSFPLGIGLVVVGIIVVVESGFRYRRYIRAIDQERFRQAFGTRFTTLLAVALALIGLVMAAYLIQV